MQVSQLSKRRAVQSLLAERQRGTDLQSRGDESACATGAQLTGLPNLHGATPSMFVLRQRLDCLEWKALD